MASITILWESELITLLPARTSLAQYCPIDPKVEPATWLLVENPTTIKQPHLTTNTDIPIITSCNVVIASHINSSVKIPLSTTIIIALHVADRSTTKSGNYLVHSIGKGIIMKCNYCAWQYLMFSTRYCISNFYHGGINTMTVNESSEDRNCTSV